MPFIKVINKGFCVGFPKAFKRRSMKAEGLEHEWMKPSCYILTTTCLCYRLHFSKAGNGSTAILQIWSPADLFCSQSWNSTFMLISDNRLKKIHSKSYALPLKVHLKLEGRKKEKKKTFLVRYQQWRELFWRIQVQLKL